MNGYPDDGMSVRRIMPQSGLDFNMMLTDTMYGSQQVSRQLSATVRKREEKRARSVQHIGDEEEANNEAWELLAYFTRDFRLANLNRMMGETAYCQHYIDLAGDLLREGYMDSFGGALQRAATMLELSQSNGGFLRRRQNTLTTESLQGEMEPPKKRILSFGKQRGA